MQVVRKGIDGKHIVLGRDGKAQLVLTGLMGIEMFPQIGCLLDDMIGVIEKFQAFRCKGDAVAVPLEDGDMEFFFEFFNGRTSGWAGQ